MAITLLDGPMGTQLGMRGVPIPEGTWSSAVLLSRPEVVAEIHREYAAAGARVHTTNTFRTQRRTWPDRWEELTRLAVLLARGAAGTGRVAGSIAPLQDCYSPWLSPPDPEPEHAELAAVLAQAGCDLLLCETFPHVGEGLAAVRAAVATGVQTWVAFTAGPKADLLTPAQVGDAARQAADLGARAVLVNCVPAVATLPYVQALAGAGVPFGAYANAGSTQDGIGWQSVEASAAEVQRYADLARTWVDAGATVLGTCCGTGPAHVAELARRFGNRVRT